MQTLQAGDIFPKQQVPMLGGGTLTLGQPGGDHDWQMVVVYRGLHCPMCKKYLAKLETVKDRFLAQGVDVVAVSGDPEEKARAFVDEVGVTVPVGYGLGTDQMRALGLYISEPRSPQETDRPFPEPGIFVINDQGRVQIIDISNAPFARPDIEVLAGGVQFIRANDYPVRGTWAG